MAIVKQYHKDTDTTYVYESISYWDTEKQQGRSRRKCIGKIDPETGEIVPTGKRGRKKKTETKTEYDDSQLKEMTGKYEHTYAELVAVKEELAAVKAENEQLRKKNGKLEQKLIRINHICTEA